MSRPPISVKASPAGIISKTTGDRVVAASRRPDGTLRKELKIRPGYTPDEDVKRYRAVRAAEAEARNAVKGKIPGLAPAPAVQAAISGLSRSQVKKIKQKDKGKAEDTLNGVDTTKVDVPEAWDSDEGDVVKPEAPEKALLAPVDEGKKDVPPSDPKEDSKQIRAVRKKIRQAEILKEREKSGLYLPPPERAKVKQIPDLEAELAKMTLSEDKM